MIPLRTINCLDLQVSLLSLGTVKFGRNQGVKYPAGFELPDLKTLDHLLGTARDLGINLLDTAPAYGVSEERLGKLLARYPDTFLISTKAGETFENQESQFAFDQNAIRQSVQKSLKRLNRGVLDLVFVHSNGNDLQVIEETEVLETLKDLQRGGLIRGIGFSGKTLEGALAALPHCDAIMVTLNPDQNDELPAIRAASDEGKGVLIKKALGSGHLNPEACLRYILGHAGISSIVSGTINEHHLQENARWIVQYAGEV